MAAMLLAALGSALLLVTMTETAIAAHHDGAIEVLYGAEAALDRAIADLTGAPDLDAVLSGGAASTFTDGPPGGVRWAGGSPIDLDESTNLLRCGRRASCTGAQMAAPSGERPWGANNPRFQLYAWGAMTRLVAAAGGVYLAVWVADDPEETDGDPLRDADRPDQAGHGVVVVIAEAFGARGVRRSVQATIARRSGGDTTPPSFRVTAWREVR